MNFLFLFFVYSFLGWLLETTFAAWKQKRFVNRGLVNLPFCVLYGLAAIFITIFGQELQGIWLYAGSFIIVIVFEWIAGHMIERIYQERWWDYSDLPFQLDGYVCLPVSAFFAALAYIVVRWGNRFFLELFHLLPNSLAHLFLLILSILLALDVFATLIILNGKSKHQSRWEAVEHWFSKGTSRISQWICKRVELRLSRAYPSAKKVKTAEAKPTVFAYGCGLHKLVWLFMAGAFLGDLTETIFCRITAGIWMSRSSVVWGPFSIVWGLGIAGATLLLYRYQEKSDSFLFWAGTFLGGAFEYICSVFTELVFGKVFWDYSAIPFNLGGRINLLYCFFWGIAAVVWMKHLYPKISHWIEKLPIKTGKILTWVMILFMSLNIVVSSMAMIRSTQRLQNIPASSTWQIIMDERFDDARMQRIYPNAIVK